METPSPEMGPQIYSDTYKDIYFCEEDGLAEGDHVFLQGNGLPERWINREHFVIAETGFGTGLNFLATWLAWERTTTQDQHLTYISFEKFPLTSGQIRAALSRWEKELADKLDIMLENYPARISGWHNIVINKNITLLLIFDDVNRALPELNTYVDGWFLDGFAPAKNPEMWSETVFNAIAANSYEGTTLATFTAAGFVKRGLQNVGFQVLKKRGFGRKREMIYAHFISERLKHKNKPIRTVAVIGGGLAGANLASRCLSVGLKTDLFEEREIASGASGNIRGLFNPRFTSQKGPVSDFYASAYALVLRQFKLLKDIGFRACGSLHLLTEDEKAKRLTGAAQNWDWHSDHMRMMEADEASQLAGVEIQSKALFLPDAGFVSPKRLCQQLVKNISVIPERVDAISHREEGWIVNSRHYDAVILACGVGALSLEQTKDIPLSTVRGQISIAKPTEQASKIKTNICYGGYFSPAEDGLHVIGATFQPWLNDTNVRDEDNSDIVSKLEDSVSALSGQMAIVDARASLRVAAKDRFPVIGRLPDYENIFVSLAHGSHGLISSALAAEIIISDIKDRVIPVPKTVLKDLSPQRFIDRAAKK